MVCRSRLRPCISRCGPCRLPCGGCCDFGEEIARAPLVTLLPPVEFAAIPPCRIPRPIRRSVPFIRHPLLRFFAPAASLNSSVHLPRPCLGHSVPTSPFLTTLPVYSAGAFPRISRGSALGVLVSFRVSPVSPSAHTISDVSSPLGLASAVSAVTSSCLRVLRCSEELLSPKAKVDLQGFIRRVDRPRSLPVSRLRGYDPLLDFLCGTSSPDADCASSSSTGYPACSDYARFLDFPRLPGLSRFRFRRPRLARTPGLPLAASGR